MGDPLSDIKVCLRMNSNKIWTGCMSTKIQYVDIVKSMVSSLKFAFIAEGFSYI